MSRLTPPKLSRRAINRCLMMGRLEYAANLEYQADRYHPEKGGPALARLNAFRKDKRLTKAPAVESLSKRRGIGR